MKTRIVMLVTGALGVAALLALVAGGAGGAVNSAGSFFCPSDSGGTDTSDTVLHSCRMTIANALSLTAPTLSPVDPFTQRVGKRITSATTTQLLAGVASTSIRIFGGTICLDAGGAQTAVTLEDNSVPPVDLFTNTSATMPYQLALGHLCLDLAPPVIGTFTGAPVAAGKDLQIVTSQGGPVNVMLYLRRE